jgi:hypothetical protein
MKSIVSVLLDPSVTKPMERLREVLEPHRLDEDDPKSIHSHHWDYWHFSSKFTFHDPELRARFPEEPLEFLEHASFVRNLPTDFLTAGIILEDGTWTDMSDFGWRMIDEPSAANAKATEQWDVAAKQILAQHTDHICVRVLVHC